MGYWESVLKEQSLEEVIVNGDTMETKNKIGTGMIVVPIIGWLWLLIVNSPGAFSHCWLGSNSVDFFWGLVGIVVVMIGIALLFQNNNNESEEEDEYIEVDVPK